MPEFVRVAAVLVLLAGILALQGCGWMPSVELIEVERGACAENPRLACIGMLWIRIRKEVEL